MKKIRLIYNPISGDRSFKNRLDHVIEEFQKEGFEIIPYKSFGNYGVEKAVSLLKDDDYYALAVAGGDGTLNRVINAMKINNVDLPVGIFPWGTANDLASYFGIKRDVKQCCHNIINGKTKSIDLGTINGRYFINVASGGLLTDVSQKIDVNLKNSLGKLAYYIKGIEQIPNFRPIKVEMETEKEIINDYIYLFLVFNGCSAGGFDMLAKDALIDDGMLDVIAVRACLVVDLVPLFIKILRGEHLNDSNIIYMRTNRIKINCEYDIETDIDGESGPNFPVEIGVLPKAVNVFVP